MSPSNFDEILGAAKAKPAPTPDPTPPPAKKTAKERSPSPSPKPTKEKRTAMDAILEQTEREPTVRITVDLPQSMHQRLTMLSARSGKKKAEIVRLLLDDLLEQVED